MSVVSTSLASPIEAQRVMANLSPQTRDEFALAGEDPHDFLAAVFAAGHDAFIYSRDDAPLALFGFNDYREYTSMWTLAAAPFYRLGARGIRELRVFFRGLNLSKPLYVITMSPHPEVERWLTALGFELVESHGFRKDFVYTG